MQQLAFYMLNSMLWVQAEAAVQVSAPAGLRNGEQRASFTSWVHGSTCNLVQARRALEVECSEKQVALTFRYVLGPRNARAAMSYTLAASFSHLKLPR